MAGRDIDDGLRSPRRAPVRRTLVAMLVIAAGGCQFSTDYSTSHYACGEDDRCPAGFQCWNHYCEETIPPDAAVDAGPAIDARPAADAGIDAADHCSDVSAANSCDSYDVTAEVEAGGAVFYGDTGTVANDMATPPTSCDYLEFPLGTPGADAFYTIEPTSDATLHAKLTTIGVWHAAVYIVGGCATGSTCYDAARLDPPVTMFEVTTPVVAGNRYHVVVDSHYEVAPGTPPTYDSGCYQLELWVE